MSKPDFNKTLIVKVGNRKFSAFAFATKRGFSFSIYNQSPGTGSVVLPSEAVKSWEYAPDFARLGTICKSIAIQNSLAIQASNGETPFSKKSYQTAARVLNTLKLNIEAKSYTNGAAS